MHVSTHTLNVRHFPRVIKGLVSAAHEPSVFVHGHDVLVVPINDVFHGELVTELVRVGVARGGVDTETDPDKGEAVAGTGRVATVVTLGIPALAVVAVECAE